MQKYCKIRCRAEKKFWHFAIVVVFCLGFFFGGGRSFVCLGSCLFVFWVFVCLLPEKLQRTLYFEYRKRNVLQVIHGDSSRAAGTLVSTITLAPGMWEA